MELLSAEGRKIVTFEIEGPIFFGTAEYLAAQVETAHLKALLQDATTKECSYADSLDQVLSEKVAAKTAKHVTIRTQLARSPFVKGLDSFDFSYQPSIDREQIQTLSICHVVEHGEDLVILGKPTWPSASASKPAIEHGYRVLFTAAAVLIAPLTRALGKGRLDDKLYIVPRLLSSTRSATYPSTCRAPTCCSNSSAAATSAAP